MKQITFQVSLPQSIHTMATVFNDYSDLCMTDAMTCQELLAFSVAFSAALPTGQTTLESFYSTLTRNRTNHSNNKNSSILNTRGYSTENVAQKSPPHAAKNLSQNVSNINHINNEEFSCCYELYQNIGIEETRKKHSKPYQCVVGIYKMVKNSLHCIRMYIKNIVEHKYFQQGILLAILINTLSMGIEYHNQPEELTAIVETSNIVFSIIFAVEMVLKVIAEGPFGYVANGFNVFDGVIVILRYKRSFFDEKPLEKIENITLWYILTSFSQQYYWTWSGVPRWRARKLGIECTENIPFVAYTKTSTIHAEPTAPTVCDAANNGQCCHILLIADIIYFHIQVSS